MFDKTGTLTIGKPVVVSVKLMDTIVLEELLELTAATEVCFLSFKKLFKISKFSGMKFVKGTHSNMTCFGVILR